MKRMKSGFTLAEVLITLGIIGVVAAIVMPAVMTNYTYKTVGVKLSKFMSQVEGASRPYVVQNTSFTGTLGDISNFVQESFLIKNPNDYTKRTIECSAEMAAGADKTLCDSGKVNGEYVDIEVTDYASNDMQTALENGNATTGVALNSNGAKPIQLKDGTRFIAYPLPEGHAHNLFDAEQVGAPVWGIAFDPQVNGLPKIVNHAYRFVVTELGYIYPDETDACMAAIFANDFNTNATTFKSVSCKADGGNVTKPDQPQQPQG